MYNVGTILNCMLVVYISGLVFCSCRKLFAGPYYIEFKRCYRCDDMGEHTLRYSTKFSKINRTHVSYTGNVTLLHGYTNSMVITAEVSVFGNGGWRPNYFVVQLNHACKDVETFTHGFLKSFLGTSGLKNISCPIPAGHYFINNWVFDLNFAMQILPYNKYRLTVKLIEKGKLQSCIVLEVDAVPKKE